MTYLMCIPGHASYKSSSKEKTQSIHDEMLPILYMFLFENYRIIKIFHEKLFYKLRKSISSHWLSLYTALICIIVLISQWYIMIYRESLYEISFAVYLFKDINSMTVNSIYIFFFFNCPIPSSKKVRGTKEK